jgi:hypothetical protein
MSATAQNASVPKLFNDDDDLEALAQAIAPPTPNISTGAGYEFAERQLIKQLISGQVSPQMQRRLDLMGIDHNHLQRLLRANTSNGMATPRTMIRAHALISKLTVLAKTSRMTGSPTSSFSPRPQGPVSVDTLAVSKTELTYATGHFLKISHTYKEARMASKLGDDLPDDMAQLAPVVAHCNAQEIGHGFLTPRPVVGLTFKGSLSSLTRDGGRSSQDDSHVVVLTKLHQRCWLVHAIGRAAPVQCEGYGTTGWLEELTHIMWQLVLQISRRFTELMDRLNLEGVQDLSENGKIYDATTSFLSCMFEAFEGVVVGHRQPRLMGSASSHRNTVIQEEKFGGGTSSPAQEGEAASAHSCGTAGAALQTAHAMLVKLIQWKALPAKFKKAFFATTFIETLLAGFWSPFEFEHQVLLATLRQLYITQKRSAFRTEFRAKVADLLADLADRSYRQLHPSHYARGGADTHRLSSVPTCGKNNEAYKEHQTLLESPPPVPPDMLSPATRVRRMSFDEQPILENEILAAVAEYRNGSSGSACESEGEGGRAETWVFRLALEEQHSMAPSVLLPGVNHALALLTAVLLGVKGLAAKRAEYDPLLKVLLSLYSLQSLDAFEAQLLGCMKCFVREVNSTQVFLPAILRWFVRQTAVITKSLAAFGMVTVRLPWLPFDLSSVQLMYSFLVHSHRICLWK